MPHIDSAAVTRIIEETAREEILTRFRRLRDAEVRRKISGELVTIADEAAEVRLNARLRDLLPGSVVVGEETAANDPVVFDRLTEDDPVWIVDPVDGTGNFARGREIFAVMVALAHRGETCASWIHMPVAGTTACAETGGGAEQDGVPLKRATTVMPPARMTGTLHAGTFAGKALARQIEMRRHRVGQVCSLNCAGAEYLRLARGEIDFSLFTKLMPWDHAPGTLIFTEAGGLAQLLDGTAYRPTTRQGEALLMAPDAAGWRALHDALFGAE